MAKSKKTEKKVETPNVIMGVRLIAEAIDKIEIPAAVSDRFSPQLAKVSNRLEAIAKNMAKALELDAAKDERETKKVERTTARKAKLEAQIAKIQESLDKLVK